MRKLLLFFAMLCVSIGAWAQSVTGPTDGTLYIENFTDPSQLASVLSKQETVGTSAQIGDAVVTKLYFKNCVIDNAVLAALSNATYATLIDMDRAQFADDVDLSNVSAPAAEYITLPFGATVSDMKEISTSSCPNLKAVASMDKEPAENASFYEFQEGSISGFVSANIINSDNGLKAASSFHFGGSVGAADITYIKENIANKQSTHLLDFSDATVNEANLKNLAGANVYIENNNAKRINQAVVFPTAPAPSDDLKAHFQNGGWAYPVAYQTYAYYTDESKKELVAFCESENSCNDLPYLTPLVTDDMTLSFDKWTNGSYLQPDHDKFFAGLSGFPVGNIDFSNINISKLGTDFSGLNAATHYITIATANKDNSGNVKPDIDDVSASGYNYGLNIYAVSTFKEPGDNNNNYVNYSGISYTPGNSTNDNTLITYVTAAGAGKLSGAKNYLSEKQKSATRMNVLGTLNSADVAALGDVPVEKIDLMFANISDADMASFASATVKYLALPDGKANLMGVTSADDYAFKKSCPALLCVGSYNPTTNVYSTYSTKNLGADGKQISSVNVVTRMIKPIYNVTDAARMESTNFCTDLESVIMSGYLNLDDINTNNGNALSGLSSGTIKHGDLTNAVFPTAADMSFIGDETNGYPGAGWSLTGSGSGATLILPVSSQVTTIPPYSLWNAKGLTSICVPGNIKYIEEGALGENIEWNTIYTTEVDENGDGRGATVGKDRALSITLPAALLHIGTNAFWNAQRIRDVYSTSTDHVPACDVYAFSPGTCSGWGGASYRTASEGTAAREDFDQHAVLHWPDGLTLEQIKKYTDITRVYTYADRDGKTDDRGNILMWPSGSEYWKAHNQAVSGYTWEAWADADNITPSMTGNADCYENQALADQRWENNGSPKGVTYEDYVGWHQFVLTANWSASQKFEAKPWSTICIPYDVTYDQLIAMYGVTTPMSSNEKKIIVDSEGFPIANAAEGVDAEGEVSTILYPTVSTLTSVNRKVTYKKSKTGEYVQQSDGTYKKMTAEELKNVDPAKRYVAGNGLITLQFTEGMVTKAAEDGKVYNWKVNSDYAWTPGSVSSQTGEWEENSDGVIMKAGYPYHLKVYVPLGTENIRTYAMNELEAAGATESAQQPYNEWIVPTTGNSGGDELKYKFKGYYDLSASAVALPMHSYFLWVPKSGESLWYRYEQSWGAAWGQNNPIASYAALIGLIGEDGTWPEYDLMLTDKTSGAQAKGMLVVDFGDGSETEATGISDVQVDAEDATGRVYNMNGQVVSETGSLQGLGKGIYIINGKKYIVK